jgi:hypothetical protein
MWANEQEAAVLSGVPMDQYRCKVARWEARGFPTANPENGKRSIPAILAFWGFSQNLFAAAMTLDDTEANDDDGQENWGGRDQSERRAS